MECIRQINRTIKKAKKEKSQIHIPNLGNPKLLQIIAYSDASFANLTDGGSQGGYIIFLVGNNNQYMPIAWQSKHIKRIVKSTLGAETLAMVDLTEACFYYRKLILDLLQLEDHPMNIKITCKTDNSVCMTQCIPPHKSLIKDYELKWQSLEKWLTEEKLQRYHGYPLTNKLQIA